MALYALAQGPSDPLFWLAVACIGLPFACVIVAAVEAHRRTARERHEWERRFGARCPW